jgi:hypothetical protein
VEEEENHLETNDVLEVEMEEMLTYVRENCVANFGERSDESDATVFELCAPN